MSAPIVSWYEADNENVISKWDIGVVDAGQPSAEKTILIWNNRGGTEDVAHMQDARITTTDGDADTLDVVADRWVRCRVDTIEGDTFTQIGGTVSKEIRASNCEEGIIKGVANEGLLEDVQNYAKVTLYAQPNLHGVTAGKRNFKLRVSYFYV